MHTGYVHGVYEHVLKYQNLKFKGHKEIMENAVDPHQTAIEKFSNSFLFLTIAVQFLVLRLKKLSNSFFPYF